MSRTHPMLWGDKEYPGALACNQPEGSFMFVPRGWSHAVINTASETVGAAVEFVDLGSKEAKDSFIGRVHRSPPYAIAQDLHRTFPI